MRDQYFVLVLVAALVAGCQSKTDVADGPQNGESQSDVVDVNSNTNSEEATTESGVVLNPVRETEPHQVCEAFLRFLQVNNVTEAQKLLTRKAISLTLRHELPLGFPGEDGATFKASPAKFATYKKELCQVMCQIREDVDGKETTADMGWMLKKQNDGWRISGVMLPLEEGKPMDYLSFESTIDIKRVKSMLSGGPEQEDTRQASNTGITIQN